jgi:endonuclease YncB( thermonuclease family)
MLRRLLVPLGALLIMAGVLAVAARGATGPCVAGTTTPSCTFWDGKVTSVSDGDTMRVRLSDGRDVIVRVSGINAMELSNYDTRNRQGACHGVEAADRTSQLVKEAKGRVRLSAIDPTSHSRNRERRSVQLLISRHWVDLGRTLLSEGLALWLPAVKEWAWNARYSTVVEDAAARRVGMWDASACGEGPNEGQPIKLWANWDGDGNDSYLFGPNSEWIRIKNLDAVNPLPLGGWWLRDADLPKQLNRRQYVFRSDAVIPPGGTMTVYLGPGTNTELDKYWGLNVPLLDNVNRDKEAGDGAYLFDPDGDLRAYMMYPCRVNCGDPNQGALQLAVKTTGSQWVEVRNVSIHPVGLEDYRLSMQQPNHVYTFAPDTTLQPGETLRIMVEGDPDEDQPLLRGWGQGTPIFPKFGGAIRLSSYRDVVLACVPWGDGEC